MSREPEAGAGTYLLRQTFRYNYTSPVRRLRHRLIVVPRTSHGGQRLVDHEVSVRGVAASVSAHEDAFGNRVLDVRAERVAESIEFDLWALVHRDGPGGETPVAAGAAAAGAGAGRLTSAFSAATPLTAADPFLREVAADLAAGSGSGLALAERACSWTRAALGYQHDVTTVRTTAAEAVAGGKGVCQDYAHVMLALCRAAGLPARYVSGHLVGEGGSHAWVEVITEAGVAVAFDPTHDRRADWGYVTVAVGRDYADVAPTSGRFSGEGPGRLTATKTLALVDAASVLI